MTASTKARAWAMVDAIFPTDYAKDDAASARAGYDVYRGRDDDRWISDLGNRLEINLDGETVNIWIDDSDDNGDDAGKAIHAAAAQEVSRRKYVTLEIESENVNGCIFRKEASLFLSQETTFSEIAEFEKTAQDIIKRARRDITRGSWVNVILAVGVYRGMTMCNLKMWEGSGDHITADGVHLAPDDGNNDPAHDMWLTGDRGKILEELTV